MRCDDFQQRWQALLDERRLPQQDEILCAHAETCADCSEILRIQTVLFRELERSKNAGKQKHQANSRQPVRQPGHKQAVPSTSLSPPSARYFGYRTATRRQIAKSLFIGLAVAGSLLVLLIPAWRLSTTRDSNARSRPHVARSGTRALPPTIWVAKTPSPTPAKPPEVAPSQTAGITAEQEALRRLMQNMAAKLSDVPEEQLEPLDRIAGGFRPLANTLGVAWDALRRTIPVGRSQAVNEPQAILGWPGLQAVPT